MSKVTVAGGGGDGGKFDVSGCAVVGSGTTMEFYCDLSWMEPCTIYRVCITAELQGSGADIYTTWFHCVTFIAHRYKTSGKIGVTGGADCRFIAYGALQEGRDTISADYPCRCRFLVEKGKVSMSGDEYDTIIRFGVPGAAWNIRSAFIEKIQ